MYFMPTHTTLGPGRQAGKLESFYEYSHLGSTYYVLLAVTPFAHHSNTIYTRRLLHILLLLLYEQEAFGRAFTLLFVSIPRKAACQEQIGTTEKKEIRRVKISFTFTLWLIINYRGTHKG